MPKIKITKTMVDALPLVQRGQANYVDAALPGFGVYVGRTSKTYFVQRDLRGRTVKLIIGKHGVFTPEEARNEARLLLNQLARGIDPRREKQQEAARGLTLRQAWQEFKTARAMRSQSVQNYGCAIERNLSDWLDIPLAEISAEQIIHRHAADAARRGPAWATRNLRIFRTVYRFAKAVHRGMLPECPTDILSDLHMWHRDQRRRTYIKSGDLPRWYAAVMALGNDSARDYLRLILFTGMRRSEAMRLRWENVDFEGRTLTIPTTKNGDPLVLPLSLFLQEMLKARRQRFPDDEWVFFAVGARGHLQEPKKWVYKVAEASGIKFGLHDLRRTFITVAESLDISVYTLKRLLNHREGRDVTAGYIVLDVERLRRPMERITDFLLSACQSSATTRIRELQHLA